MQHCPKWMQTILAKQSSGLASAQNIFNVCIFAYGYFILYLVRFSAHVHPIFSIPMSISCSLSLSFTHSSSLRSDLNSRAKCTRFGIYCMTQYRCEETQRHTIDKSSRSKIYYVSYLPGSLSDVEMMILQRCSTNRVCTHCCAKFNIWTQSQKDVTKSTTLS